MMTFATVEDLQARMMRQLDSDETEYAQTLLEDASARLATLLRRSQVDIDPADEIQLNILKQATCNMVIHVLNAPAGGVSSISQNIGETSASIAFSNPDASAYLSKSDKIALGLVGSKYRSIQAHTYADDCPFANVRFC